MPKHHSAWYAITGVILLFFGLMMIIGCLVHWFEGKVDKHGLGFDIVMLLIFGFLPALLGSRMVRSSIRLK